MKSTLGGLENLTSNDPYYNDDDSEEARSIGDNESDAGSTENAGDVLQGEEAAPKQKQQLSVVAPIASAAPSNGLLSGNLLLNAGNSATMPSLKFKTVDLTCTASLHGIKSGTEAAVFKPEFDISKRLGGDNVRVSKMFVIGFDFSAVPVSLGLKIDSALSDVAHTHESASGPVFFVGKALKEKEFAHPLVFFHGVENDFKHKMAIKFPGVDETNVANAVMPSPTRGVMLVSKGSIVASQVEDIINEQIQAAQAKGEIYNGPTMAAMESKEFDSYKVDEKLANAAVNVIKTLFSATNNTINLSKQLQFQAVRTKLSPDTIEKISSSTADAWTDPHEISMLVKSGASLDSITKSKFHGSVTIGIEYVEMPKVAKK